MKTVPFSDTVITGGFWKEKQKLIRDVSVKAIYDRFKETGRIDSFKCEWKEGMPFKPHFFWDSDGAKWIESVAYLSKKKREPKLEALCDEIIRNLIKNQDADGYFNIYFTVVEPENRFKIRSRHELYCAGHLIEAAVAYYDATGKRALLDAMCKYADYIEKRFKINHDAAFNSPGHEEIELALVKLSECTGEKRYYDLAKFFIDERGKKVGANGADDNVYDAWTKPEYQQSHLPVREQTEAVGHAVRAVYLYCAMADIAERSNDEGLLAACKTLFDDIINKKMYITGGIGSAACGESFTVPYDLSNLLAYTESCAAIGLAWFANRMLRLEADSKYSDTVERILYNGFLSSISLNGKEFFYENPLEVLPYLLTRDTCTNISHPNAKNAIHWPQAHRSEVFTCSCCPPNITRFIGSIADMLYTHDDDTIYVHQFMQSKTDFGMNGKRIHVEQKTRYPYNGKISITVSGADTRVAVRIPGWYDGYQGKTVKGYAYFDVKDGETVTLDFPMKVKFIEARPEAVFDCGKYAVQKGPIVYCMEAEDNGELLRDVVLDGRARFTPGVHPTLGVPTLSVRAYRRKRDENAPLYSERHNSLVEFQALLIPFYAFANRSVCEMQVWHRVK